MDHRINLRAAGHATSLVLAGAFTVCVIYGLLVPGAAMHTVWGPFLPGFVWISPGSFVLGLVESYLYGWLLSAPWVWLYNRFAGAR